MICEDIDNPKDMQEYSWIGAKVKQRGDNERVLNIKGNKRLFYSKFAEEGYKKYSDLDAKARQLQSGEFSQVIPVKGPYFARVAKAKLEHGKFTVFIQRDKDLGSINNGVHKM
jgi:HSP20 family molecular chaperone IbpA